MPSRREPDEGEVNYPEIFAVLDRLGYAGFIGWSTARADAPRRGSPGRGLTASFLAVPAAERGRYRRGGRLAVQFGGETAVVS